MDNNNDSQIPVAPNVAESLPQQSDSQTNQIQSLPSEPQVLITETKVIKKHSWIDYILITLSILQASAIFFGKISMLGILGSVYYSLTAFFLFKKPIVGYIMFGTAIVLFVISLIIFNLTLPK